MKKNYITFFILTAVVVAHGQDSLKKFSLPDTTRLQDFFRNSKIEVNARSFFMSTINDGALKDDYALATSIGTGIITKPIFGLQAGISGLAVYNLWSTNLASPDPVTLGANRYEVGLFDIQNLTATHNLVRIENLFLRYNLSRSSVTVGKMKLNTPFLNPQDGRMNITMEEGAWLNLKESKYVQINGGWIWNISPRSTTRWYSAANSIGIYPVGVSENGAKSNYFGNIQSSGILLANIFINPTEKLKINLWEMVVDNVMNTSMVEINSEFGKTLKFYQGAMFIHQDAINNGGNPDQTKTYITKNSQSNAISAQLGIKTKKINESVNYTHITGDGRYLAPREWGRDPFYTFMLREKNDGLGNVHAFSVKNSVFFFQERFKTSLVYGYYHLPDVKNYRLNKYGMPSYHQINVDLGYSFSKFLKGFEIRFIAAYKLKEGNTYNNPKYIYNKVNMVNLNLIADFKL